MLELHRPTTQPPSTNHPKPTNHTLNRPPPQAAIDDAEEEELWSLTLAAQLKHLQKHFGVDLPHGVIAHMDPLLIKKVDWETTNNLEDWDITLDVSDMPVMT